MNKAYYFFLLFLILPAAPTAFYDAEVKNLPPWIADLCSNISGVFKIQVGRSRVDAFDDIEKTTYKIIRLQGEGRFKEESNPFETMRDLFLSKGWKEDWKYAADGHGSSSTAYRKANDFCIVRIQIESSCDDEQTGHIPGLFWFSVDCRE